MSDWITCKTTAEFLRAIEAQEGVKVDRKPFDDNSVSLQALEEMSPGTLTETLEMIGVPSRHGIILQRAIAERLVFRRASGEAKVASQAAHNGLLNHGSTCYLNSLLQTYFHIPAFQQVVFNLQYSELHPVVQSLQRVFYDLKYGDSPAETRCLMESLGFSNEEMAAQQDIEEVNNRLCEMLEHSENQSVSSNTYFKKLLTGKYKDVITCDELNSSVTPETEFRALPLEVRGKASVEESIKCFFGSETTIEDYEIQQNGKPAKVVARKVSWLLELPRILLLHLKRFVYDPVKHSLEKLLNELTFTEELDLTPFVQLGDRKGSCSYTLYSVLVHVGDTAVCGHYISFIRIKNEWWKFNDEDVTPTKWYDAAYSNFEGRSCAYMLVYIKSDVYDAIISRTCTVPPPLMSRFLAEDLSVLVAVKEPSKRVDIEVLEVASFEELQQQHRSFRHVKLWPITKDVLLRNSVLGGLLPDSCRPKPEELLEVDRTSNWPEAESAIAEFLKKGKNTFRLWCYPHDSKRPFELVAVSGKQVSDAVRVGAVVDNVVRLFVEEDAHAPPPLPSAPSASVESFLEEIFGEAKPPPGPAPPVALAQPVLSGDVLLLVKSYLPKERCFLYNGSLLAPGKSTVDSLTPHLQTLVAARPDSSFWFWKEGGKFNLVNLEPAKSIESSGLSHGSLLLIQEKSQLDNLPDAKRFLEFVSQQRHISVADLRTPNESSYISLSDTMTFLEVQQAIASHFAISEPSNYIELRLSSASSGGTIDFSPTRTLGDMVPRDCEKFYFQITAGPLKEATQFLAAFVLYPFEARAEDLFLTLPLRCNIRKMIEIGQIKNPHVDDNVYVFIVVDSTATELVVSRDDPVMVNAVYHLQPYRQTGNPLSRSMLFALHCCDNVELMTAPKFPPMLWNVKDESGRGLLSTLAALWKSKLSLDGYGLFLKRASPSPSFVQLVDQNIWHAAEEHNREAFHNPTFFFGRSLYIMKVSEVKKDQMHRSPSGLFATLKNFFSEDPVPRTDVVLKRSRSNIDVMS